MTRRVAILLVAVFIFAASCSSRAGYCQTPDLAVHPSEALTPGEPVTVSAPFGIISCGDGGSPYNPVSPGSQVVHIELSKYTGPGPGEAANEYPVSIAVSDWITGHLDPDTGDLAAEGSIPPDLPAGEYFALLAENETIHSGHFQVSG